MTRIAGWMLAGAILLAMGSKAQAQVIIGNPYAGNGIAIGAPAYGYGGYTSFYGPATTYYSSGYAGYAPVGVYGRPVIAPYRTYGYGYGPGYGYGYRPYRRYRRW